MKEMHGTATASVAASVEECFGLLEAVDRYPSWYPGVVREADVVSRDGAGHPTRTRATLHASVGPIVRDFRVLLDVTVERFSVVKLARVSRDPSDSARFEVIWRLQHGPETQIHLTLVANLSVPRFVPVGGIGDSMAAGFVDAATTALGEPRD